MVDCTMHFQCPKNITETSTPEPESPKSLLMKFDVCPLNSLPLCSKVRMGLYRWRLTFFFPIIVSEFFGQDLVWLELLHPQSQVPPASTILSRLSQVSIAELRQCRESKSSASAWGAGTAADRFGEHYLVSTFAFQRILFKRFAVKPYSPQVGANLPPNACYFPFI